MRPDPIVELEALVENEWLPAFCADRGVQPFHLAPGTFHSDEARSFLRGLRQGLFGLEADGFHFSWIRRNAPLRPFWHGARAGHPRLAILAREIFVTLGAASDLHLDYGWPLDQIEIETKDGAFDLAVYEGARPRDAMVLAGESKPDIRKLEKLITGLRACCARGQHAAKDCRSKEHPKYVGIRSRRPRFFWGLAPGERILFEVAHTGGIVELRAATDLPRADPAKSVG